MTDREREILDIIKKDPLISQNDLAEELNITRSSVAVHISNLIKKGYIKGKGYVISNEKSEVVVIGGANIDITGVSDNSLIAEDSNPGSISLALGGVGRNIGENLARLGVNVKLISAIGDDLYGEKILEESSAVGLDMSLTKKYTDSATSVYLQVLNSNKHMSVAIADMNIMEKITIELLEKNHRHLDNATVIVADGNLTEEAILYLANAYGDKLFFDSVSSSKTYKIKDCFNKFLCLAPNLIEAEVLLGKKIEDKEKALLEMRDKGTGIPVITLGDKGLIYLNEGKAVYVEAKKDNIVSVTGAGDALLSGLIYGYISKMDIKDMIDFGMTMAKITLDSTKTVSDKMTLDYVNENRRK